MMVNEKKKRMGKRKKLMITKENRMQKDNLIEDPLPHKTYTSHINERSFGFMNKLGMHRERENERMIESTLNKASILDPICLSKTSLPFSPL